MRIGRAGIFSTPNGTIGVGAVMAIVSDSQAVIKEAITGKGQLILVNRGEFHIFDAGGHNAAELVRESVTIALGGRELLTAELEDVIPLREFTQDISSTPAARKSRATNVSTKAGQVIDLTPAVLQAIRQVVRQILNKKRPTNKQVVRVSDKTISKKRKAVAA